jgi:hypothetical protein
MSDKFLPTLTLLYVSVRHTFISLTSFIGIPNLMRTVHMLFGTDKYPVWYTGRYKCYISVVQYLQWARIAQSVYKLAMGWTVRRSNPGGGEIFCTRPDWPWGPPVQTGPGAHPSRMALGPTRPDWPWGPLSLLYNWYWVSFPGGKKLGHGTDHSPHLVPRLKKE